jgi:hypothetical protein
MTTYRIYILNAAGMITGPAIEVVHDDDTAAIADAKQRLNDTVIEVWRGRHQVAVLDPKQINND